MPVSQVGGILRATAPDCQVEWGGGFEDVDPVLASCFFIDGDVLQSGSNQFL